ncbi:hypothetical protein KQI38_09715 [Tissierella carlieri]|uniref:hypothetical protein n=1 Tax=Tissierella carlieri TaxID=689904 RepID=UPI001C109B99|nr:hypothetical protein [Tissierella carlieri]MBU5312305.1 hypothetical protein [Tissierella carlieri]
MANKIKGLVIEIGGETTALTKALGEVNKHSKDLQSELRNVERLLKLDPKSTELLKQKQEILAESIDNTKKKLETLKDAEKQAQEQFKQGKIAEDQYRAIQREVIKTEQDLKKLDDSLKETNSKWKELEKSLDKAGTKMEDMGKGMTKKITVPILAAGAASFKLGADFEDAFGKAETVFGHNARAIEAWSKTALRDFGLARGTALSMVTDFAAGFNQLGMDIQKSTEWSKNLAARVNDLSTYYNASLEETQNALTAIQSGATEPLKKFNIFMTQANLQQFAYEKGIKKSIIAMNEREKVELRYQYVMSKTAQAHGNFKKEQDSATAQMTLFKESIKELFTVFSEQVLPIFTPIIEGVNKMIQILAGMDEGIRNIIVKVGLLVAVIGPVLIMLGNVFKAISNISDGLKVAKGAIDLVGKAGSAISNLLSAISNLLSATGSWGFKEWALAIGGIIALLTILLLTIDAFFNKGRGITRMVDGLSDAINSIGGTANSGNNIANKYISGSHRNGLDYVPRDNYIAQLHEGERVLTKSENQRYSQGSGDTFILQVNMDEVDEVYKLTRVFENFKQTKRAGLVRG